MSLAPMISERSGHELTLGKIFAAFVVIGFANGEYLRVYLAIESLGLLDAVYATFNISLLIWFGIYLYFDLMSRSTLSGFGPWDATVWAMAAAAFLTPVSGLAWCGTTLLALHILLVRKSDDLARRASWVLLALSVSSFWAKQVFRLFTDLILQIDAFLVAIFAGASYTENLVYAADGRTVLKVLEGCSSFNNLSLAFLGWIMARAYYGTTGFSRSVLFIVISCAVVLLVNTTRIGIIALRPDLYDIAHGPVGANIANLTITFAIAAISLHGARR